jgi:exosortase
MKLDTRIVLALALTATGFAVLYWRVLTTLADAWWTDGNYSHGFLIGPVAIYLAWERRRRLADLAQTPTRWGLVIIAGSLALLTGGILGAELFTTRISMIGTLAGIVLFLFGREHLRVLAFPLAFLILAIPLPAIIFNQIAFPLQLIASRVGESTLTTFDIPVLREGNVLILANTSLEVAEACSGIRSLVSLLTLGLVFGYFADTRGWVRSVIALSSVPVAILTNAARVAGTGIAAQRFGPAAADGFLHEFAGWTMFAAAFGLLALLQRVIVWLAPARKESSVEAVTREGGFRC